MLLLSLLTFLRALTVQDIAAIIMAGGVLYGVIRQVPKLLDNAHTMRELNYALEESRTNKAAAQANERAAKAWESNYNALVEKYDALLANYRSLESLLEEVSSRLKTAQDELQQARSQLTTTQAELAAAVMYLADLISHLKSGGKATNIPQVPEAVSKIINSLIERLNDTRDVLEDHQ